jgi:MFS family permease
MSTLELSKGHDGPLRALAHHNFRMFYFGQLLSLIGSWMQGLAQSWLILVLADPEAARFVLHHGGDATGAVNTATHAVQATANRYQGWISFLQGLPLLGLLLFAGVLIDRVNKRKLLIVTQIGFMLCALTVGLLIRFGVAQISQVMFIAFCVGLFLAFDMPARQTFIVEMVGKKDLPSAVALNSALFNSARAIGPAVAGLLLASHVSLSTCFLANAASYLIVIACLFLMRGKNLGSPVPHPEGRVEMRFWEDIRAGARYVWNNHTTRNVLFLVGGLGLFAFSYNALIPTFVRYTLLPHATNAVQVKAFGFLEMVRGIGAFTAAVSFTLLSKPNRYKWYLIGGGLVSNGLLMVLAWAHSMSEAYCLMTVTTGGFILIFASANTVMQMSIPDNLRGRVMAIYTLVFTGTGPIGSLMAGLIAQYAGVPWTIFGFALVTIMIVIAVSFRPGGLATIRFGEPVLHAVKVETQQHSERSEEPAARLR